MNPRRVIPLRKQSFVFLAVYGALMQAWLYVTPAFALPPLVRLEQAPPRRHARIKLPHTLGPVIPGLRQGAVPQGLAYWEKQDWLLISCYFEKRPSVVVAVDRKTRKLVRCLTLVNPNGDAHDGHVGGLAVSEKYLWIGSGRVFRVPLDELAGPEQFAHLQLRDPFRAEATASYLSYHDKRLWVGEFVDDNDVKPNHPHRLKDRNGQNKYAWICGYDLDENDDLLITNDQREAVPAVVLSVRDKVQGLAVTGEEIVLSVSYGRTNDSTLAIYQNPTKTAPHRTVTLRSGHRVPLWFLDGQNRIRQVDFSPMSEGIAVCEGSLAIICESGAEKYQKGGRDPLDRVIYLHRPAMAR